MAIILTESQVTSLLDMPMAMTAVEDVLRNQAEGYATNRPRQRVFGNAALLHVMAGGDRRLGVYGLKTYSVSKNGARFLVLLFDSTSGDLLAMIEADRLGEMRTGAASGVATKYMARLDADTVGIIGTGWQAESQLMAVCAARQIRHVKAYSRSAEKRNAFAKRMSSIVGVEVEPVSTAEEAVRGRSIVITATTSREPVLQGAWIEPGTHLNIAGSNSLAKAEVDIDAIKRAAIIAVDSIEQSKMEAGDLLPALERGLISWESVSELGRVVAGQVAGRRSPEDITLFKSNGIAIWDVATALRVYNAARERGIGRQIDLWAGED